MVDERCLPRGAVRTIEQLGHRVRAAGGSFRTKRGVVCAVRHWESRDISSFAPSPCLLAARPRVSRYTVFPIRVREFDIPPSQVTLVPAQNGCMIVNCLCDLWEGSYTPMSDVLDSRGLFELSMSCQCCLRRYWTRSGCNQQTHTRETLLGGLEKRQCYTGTTPCDDRRVSRFPSRPRAPPLTDLLRLQPTGR